MSGRRPPFDRRLLRHPGELVRWIAGRPSRRRVKVSTSLRVLHEVLGLESLHYGLWEGEPLTREGLKSAQARYSRELASWIPDGVRRVLDVGAGTGRDARELARRGYEVEGLSPDPYQKEVFERHAGRPFHLARFQDFTAAEPYDLILMSESAQYIWIEALFDKARELAPGGWLLMADYFLAETPPQGAGKTAHPLPELLRRAAAAGFTLDREEDVTERAAPTLELARLWMERHVEPALSVATDTLAERLPVVSRLAGFLVRGQRRKLERELATLDPAEFRRTKRYLFLLFRGAGPRG